MQFPYKTDNRCNQIYIGTAKRGTALGNFKWSSYEALISRKMQNKFQLTNQISVIIQSINNDIRNVDKFY